MGKLEFAGRTVEITPEDYYVLFETASLKAAKKYATRNRYYNGRLTVPCIFIRRLDGLVVLAAVGEYCRSTGRTKWMSVY